MQITIEIGPRSDRPGKDTITISDDVGGKLTLPRSKLKALLRLLHSMTLTDTALFMISGTPEMLAKRKEAKAECQKNAGKPKSAE